MPLPLILAALGSAISGAGAAGAAGGLGSALTGLGASGMAGQGALTSLAGPQAFLGAAPFGASGFMGNMAGGGLPALMGQGGMSKNSLIQGVAKNLMKGGSGGLNMQYIKRQPQQGGIMNQRSRRG